MTSDTAHPNTPPSPGDSGEYSVESIQVMRGRDAVRKRPHMFVGDTTDGTGLHHMVCLVVEHAICGALQADADRLDVTLNRDGSVSVADNGSGLPIDFQPEPGQTATRMIFTKAQAPTGRRLVQFPGYGIHWAGVEVVGALSAFLELRVWRDGKERLVRCHDGEPETDSPQVADAPPGKRGTQVTFLPSPAIFGTTRFDRAVLEGRLRAYAARCADIRITLTDSRDGGHQTVNVFPASRSIAPVSHPRTAP